MGDDAPIRVAIVGGGCAGMTAAFELSRPEHRGKYAVTVYQRGFRLGGKGASGRGPYGRIEEHGLHVWMGYYENAFRLMRQCYEELGRDPTSCPIASFESAFVPASYVAAADQHADGRWSAWQLDFPAFPGAPGETSGAHRSLTVAEYMSRLIALARKLLESASARAAVDVKDAAAPPRTEPVSADELRTLAFRLLEYGTLIGFGAVLEGLRLLELGLTLTAAGPLPDNLLIRLLEAVRVAAQQQLETYVRDRDELRRVWSIVDLVLATVRGSIRHRLLTHPRGFDALDEYDCREWLLMNGASPASLQSAFVRALYDLGFAYEDGDTSRPRIAAGASMRGFLRAFFTYRGAFFWKMTAGMGDIVFAPLYEVLSRRGVRFEFFHPLRNVRLSRSEQAESPHVAALEFDVQARVRDPGGYRPLAPVRGLPCFASEPDYAQLLDGERLRAEGRNFEWQADVRREAEKTLEVGRDFDLVVLAIGLGAVPHVCSELVARDARWRSMVDHVKTVPTKAVQLWLDASVNALGWAKPGVSLSGFVDPFDTWADMTHLGPLEDWPVPPASIAYFCSVLRDDPSFRGDRAAALAAVRAYAVEFLNRQIGHLWPDAIEASGKFRWELLKHAAQDADERALDRQYMVANVDPSERYVLSLPGSNKYRISPLDDTYDNLTVAGDWTACGLNLGCVEAAVMSGLLAAHAISQSPPLSHIVGFDHP